MNALDVYSEQYSSQLLKYFSRFKEFREIYFDAMRRPRNSHTVALITIVIVLESFLITITDTLIYVWMKMYILLRFFRSMQVA